MQKIIVDCPLLVPAKSSMRCIGQVMPQCFAETSKLSVMFIVYDLSIFFVKFCMLRKELTNELV